MMLLPTKGLSPSRSLLVIAAQILPLTMSAKTLTQLWDEIRASRAKNGETEFLAFEWFGLALTLLYAMGRISIAEDGKITPA